jgi:hypothetical protein
VATILDMEKVEEPTPFKFYLEIDATNLTKVNEK